MCEPKDFAFGGDRCRPTLSTCSKCSPSKGGISLWGPFVFPNAHLRITCRLRPTRIWNNVINHSSGNIIVTFLSFVQINPWLPKQPIYGWWMVSSLHEPHLTHSSVIKELWTSTQHGYQPINSWHASWWWLECMKKCQKWKWSCFCYVGNACEGVGSNRCLPLQCKLCMNNKDVYFGKSGINFYITLLSLQLSFCGPS